MATNVRSLEQWIGFALGAPDKVKLNGEPAACIGFSLVHVTGHGEKEIHAWKIGGKQYSDESARQLGLSIRGFAETDAQNLTGSQQYCIYALYEDEPAPKMRFVLKINGQLFNAPGDLSSEPPTTEGRMMSLMRKEEALHQAYMGSLANLISQQNQFMNLQGQRLEQSMRENRDMLDFTREMLFEKITQDREHELKVKQYERNTQLMTKAMQFAPSALNTLTGKEIIPQNTADTMLIEALADAIDEESLPSLMPLLSKIPDAARGLIFKRLQEITEKKEQEKKRMQEHMNGLDPKRMSASELDDDDHARTH